MIGNFVKKQSGEAGFGSLYSILITVSLSAIPLSLLFSVNTVSKRTDSRVYDRESEVYLFHYLDKITDESAQVGVRLTPRRHNRGLIMLTSGEPLIVSKTPDLLPDRISDAITWIDTDFALALVVNQITLEGGIIACFLHGGARSISRDTTRFLVLTRDGVFETGERLPHSSARQSCPLLELQASESIIADSKDNYYHPGAALVIPIERISTLYRDSLGTLRLLIHEGSAITSNQPLRAKVPLIRFEELRKFDQMVALRISLEAPEQLRSSHSAYRLFHLLPPSYLTLVGNSIYAR